MYSLYRSSVHAKAGIHAPSRAAARRARRSARALASRTCNDSAGRQSAPSSTISSSTAACCSDACAKLHASSRESKRACPAHGGRRWSCQSSLGGKDPTRSFWALGAAVAVSQSDGGCLDEVQLQFVLAGTRTPRPQSRRCKLQRSIVTRCEPTGTGSRSRRCGMSSYPCSARSRASGCRVAPPRARPRASLQQCSRQSGQVRRGHIV